MHPVNSPWNLVACHPAKELHLARSAKSSWLRPASPRCTERSFKKYVLIKYVYRHLLPTLGSWGAEAPQQKANPDRHWKLMVLFPSFRATRKKQIWVHILCIFVREHRHQQVLKQLLHKDGGIEILTVRCKSRTWNYSKRTKIPTIYVKIKP